MIAYVYLLFLLSFSSRSFSLQFILSCVVYWGAPATIRIQMTDRQNSSSVQSDDTALLCAVGRECLMSCVRADKDAVLHIFFNILSKSLHKQHVPRCAKRREKKCKNDDDIKKMIEVKQNENNLKLNQMP